MRSTVLLLCMALAVAGCARFADSRLNPANWFGRSTAAAPADPATIRPLTPDRGPTVTDGRVPIAQVLELRVDRQPGGAIIVATGLAARQGAFNAELVLIGVEGSTLVYQFRVEQPQGAAVGPDATRVVTVAEPLTAAELAGVTAIRVEGAGNARVSRR